MCQTQGGKILTSAFYRERPTDYDLQQYQL